MDKLKTFEEFKLNEELFGFKKKQPKVEEPYECEEFEDKYEINSELYGRKLHSFDNDVYYYLSQNNPN